MQSAVIRKIVKMSSIALALSVGAANADVVIKIGHASALSGPIAHVGKDNEYGARLAIDDLNAKKIKIGGQVAKFELISEDDAADPKLAVVVAQKLVDAKVSAVIGHLTSGTSIPAAKLYADAGIPQITPSATNPKFTQQGFKTTFRMVANDIQQGSAMGKFAVKDLKAKTVAIIDDRSAYGQGLADEVEKAVKASGAKVIAREYGTDKTTDWMAVLTSIKGKKPDVVLYSGMDVTAAPQLQQLRRLGLTAKYVVSDGGCSSNMLKLAGNALTKDVYCTEAGIPPEQMPQGKAFFQRFKQRFNVDVQIYAPYVYDSVMTVAQAMQAANSSDPAKYLPKLAAIQTKGVTGNIAFDAKGDIQKAAVTVKQFDSGAWKAIAVVR
ncbi:branched-chain amino acid ABC transporter substrate-binding protein [Leeia sp. TBRC 13508]|uniref:Branched-chain amino acid ABC transporter substrate-binding protein n=1 Tax=Leeia speluncae TaxID=2884804 RepID=A0ABS8DAU1_9NEIS|nr:branched-chain amino acid ABC transporter substrate-binding protein [Leeia speluncae]MCB6185331.1 branched-chain amino acid ABC transporter substrate-binding protein [Leeia speluncae]